MQSDGRAVTNDEEVVVVVDQFVCGWQAPAQHFSHGTDQCCGFRIEFADKTCKLLFTFNGGLRSSSCSSFHDLGTRHRSLIPQRFETLSPARTPQAQAISSAILPRLSSNF
jgi:hypothetical protein